MKMFSMSRYDDFGTTTYIDVLKFKSRSVIEITYEDVVYYTAPSLLIQVGGGVIFTFSLSVLGGSITIDVWGRHYDD